MAGFRRDPGIVKVNYALRGPVPWSAPPPYAPGTVHVSDSYEVLIIGHAQLSTGHIPEAPVPARGADDYRGSDTVAGGY